jgi:sugar phosphate isomerase/epimerase
MSRSIIACRVRSYAPFEELAFAHLAGLGIRFLEVRVPQPQAVDDLRVELQRYGLAVSTLHGECDLSRADVAEQVAAQLPVFDVLGCKIFFTSVKSCDLPLETVYRRLREVGDAVAQHGVTLALETHPDLVTNADTALQTLCGVHHPAVRINFDTANVYFYNRDADGVQVLSRLVDYVAAVHLKDTDGKYRHWYFPALGRGIVDFPEVFRILDGAGFTGPCTLEIEGIEGEERTERLVCDRVAESAGYLRGLKRL